MKNIWTLVGSIFQILVGVAGILVFAVLALGGENMTRWYITLALSVGFIWIGIMGLVVWLKNKSDDSV
jgi:uncharacterized membrane protein HdeD (DUF308 family)